MSSASIFRFGAALSKILGWTYFTAWSVSFYPQAILNWKRKSVNGLSFDFLWYNVYGFTCYSIFNLAFFYSSTIQEQYRRRYGGNENLVRINDVFFSVHALILSCITFGQTFIYKKGRNQRLSAFAIALTFITSLGIFSVYLKAAAGLNEWIDLLYFISYIKLGLSLIKYIPQAYLNYKRKSTVGWSIHNIALDFTGGTLSLLQLILDAYLANDWGGISGDPVKFGLGFVSLSFDLLFMVQHYILYRDRNDYRHDEDKGEETSLIRNVVV
ncbi:8214_t:CDS:2 [Paraglomus occultum]|uniref:8214_t:CDS:1 n=1 Tax=Paraglomus occultum TaxID=144539 RepID=A0A9N8ZNK9_9GLOM|nr:8214_t:CDS:2 [Paraglomus occultum]